MSNKLGLAGIIVALILGGYASLRSPEQVNITREVQNQNLGALAGPDIPYDYLKWGGLETKRVSGTFNTASTTLCVIATPTATSTLTHFSALPTTATSTSVTVILENRTVGYAPLQSAATTTVNYVTSYNIPANSTNVVATSSVLSSDGVNTHPSTLIKPSTYLVFYAENGGAGSIPAAGLGSGSSVFASGICKAEFDVIGR